MIHLSNVSKVLTKRDGGKVPILAPTTMSIPTNARVGIWDEDGKTKATLLELLAGALPLTSGRIVSSARISPPMKMHSMIEPQLSGLDNIAFVARVYGEDIDRTIARVDEFSEIGGILADPVNTYAPDTRAIFGISLCLSIPFDCYLADDMLLIGPKWFKDKCEAFLRDDGVNAGMIFVSARARQLSAHCDAFLVYRNHRLVPVASLDDEG